jgi:hypothetical protein
VNHSFWISGVYYGLGVLAHTLVIVAFILEALAKRSKKDS